MKDKEKCPVCGCEKYEDIIFRGSDDLSACLGRHGSVNIICCSNCTIALFIIYFLHTFVF